MVAGLQILSSGFLGTLFTENHWAIPCLGGLPDKSEVLLACHLPDFLKILNIKKITKPGFSQDEQRENTIL